MKELKLLNQIKLISIGKISTKNLISTIKRESITWRTSSKIRLMSITYGWKSNMRNTKMELKIGKNILNNTMSNKDKWWKTITKEKEERWMTIMETDQVLDKAAVAAEVATGTINKWNNEICHFHQNRKEEWDILSHNQERTFIILKTQITNCLR